MQCANYIFLIFVDNLDMFCVRVSAVSYLNTVPFVYGLRVRLAAAELLLDTPSGNAEAFLRGEADVALVPVGALPLLDEAAAGDYEIVTDYCLGARGPVRTVVVVCDGPIAEVKKIYLDPDSRTSVLLTRHLCGALWGIEPEFEPLIDLGKLENPQKGEAFLLIGDKVFGYEGRFGYSYDLAREWRALTGLPFVFAVWVARTGVPLSHLAALEKALRYGVEHIPEALAASSHATRPYALEYLTGNIDYTLDAPKRRALSLFLKFPNTAPTP